MHDLCNEFISSFVPEDDLDVAFVPDDSTEVLLKKALNLKKWGIMLAELHLFYTECLRRLELEVNKGRHPKFAVTSLRMKHLVVFLSETKKQMWNELREEIKAILDEQLNWTTISMHV